MGASKPVYPCLTPCGLQQRLTGMSCKLHTETRMRRRFCGSVAFIRFLQCAGEYVLPPAIAYVNSQPEVMGLAASQKFTVCANSKCTDSEIQAAGPHPLLSRSLSSCPSDCSGAGLCDIGTGVCLCDAGFEGTDCSSVCDSGTCIATEAVDPAAPISPSSPAAGPVDSSSVAEALSCSVAFALLLTCAMLYEIS